VCRQNLAGFKKPSAVIFVDSLPPKATGRVLKRDLQHALADRFPAQE
jgi:non-ribosomal peptide synthetase component E (peptide arylation enzyme)